MYTRSFYREEGDFSVPENYDGVALAETVKDTVEEKPSEATSEVMSHGDKRGDGGIFSFLKSPLSHIKDIPFLNSFEIGFEEILIIGIALLLLFNSDGDKECAIMLLILLFIS